MIRSSDHRQKLWVEARKAKIQQIYENLQFALDLKSLFMVTGAYKKVSYCMILREREATAVHFTRAVDDESARFRLRLFFFCVPIML